MNLPLLITLLLLSCLGTAQTNPSARLLRRDTIHLQGIVKDASGKPVSGVYIRSKTLDVTYNTYPIVAATDIAGRFELKGIRPDDTLTVERILEPFKTVHLVEGSRFLSIVIAENESIETPRITVTAQRKKKKVLPKLKILNISELDFICNYPNIALAPSFPGGTDRFKNFLATKLKYPEKAIEHNIEGVVEVEFTVKKDGTLRDFQILRGIGYGCDEEAVRVLASSPAWNPAVNFGRPVVFQVKATVQFRLEN